MRYRIIRMFFNDGVAPWLSGGPRTRGKSNLTLEEAQAHCHDPETSSSTCTSTEGKKRTERCGPWFDGYEVMS